MSERLTRDVVEKALAKWDNINVATIVPKPESRPKFEQVQDGVSLKYNGDDFFLPQLAYEKAGRMCGVPATYLRKVPVDLMTPHLDYWFRNFPHTHMVYKEIGNVREVITMNQNKTFKIFKPRDVFTVLDDGIRKHTESRELTYDKVHVSDEKITYAIVSAKGENMGGAKRGDIINSGIRVDMDPLNENPLMVAIYMLRLVCTNGAISTTDVIKMRPHAVESLGDWAAGIIPNLMEAAVKEFARIRALQNVKVENLGMLLLGLFEKVKLTAELREALTNSVIGSEIDNQYDFYNHVTAFANRFDVSEDIRAIERLQTAAGFVANHEFCSQCHHVIK